MTRVGLLESLQGWYGHGGSAFAHQQALLLLFFGCRQDLLPSACSGPIKAATEHALPG
jgi:hypothetical protein